MQSEPLIVEFIKRSKRERYREILSKPHLRHKFTKALPHFSDFDPQYRVSLPSDKLSADKVIRELQKRNSPGIVLAISEDPTLDQKEVPLVDAVNRIVGQGIGTVLSCIPGRLAFVETEDERFILLRDNPPKKCEYLRFAVFRKDEDSHVEQGIFQAAALVRNAGYITGSDADELCELRAWFNDNLESPTSFGRGELPLGICWFKKSATAHISRIWQMVRILERYGTYVKSIRTSKPGYVVYEDHWQIVAEPFRKGTLPRR